MSRPRQDIQPTVNNDGNAQEESQVSIPYRFRTKGLFRYEKPNRHEQEVHEQAERDTRDEMRLRVEKGVFGVGVLGVAGLLCTLYLTRVATTVAVTQAKAAVDALYSQRPYISLGKADGTIAQYTAPTGDNKKGTIVLYFQNTGPVAAINFLTNVAILLPSERSQGPLFSQQSKGERHIERWQTWTKVPWGGDPVPGQISTGGSTVGANSIYEEVLDEKWTPTAEEWELIDGGKAGSSLSIVGNLKKRERRSCRGEIPTDAPSGHTEKSRPVWVERLLRE